MPGTVRVGWLLVTGLFVSAGCASERVPAPPQFLASSKATAAYEEAVVPGIIMPVCGYNGWNREVHRCSENEEITMFYLEAEDPYLAAWLTYLREYQDWLEATYVRPVYRPMMHVELRFLVGSKGSKEFLGHLWQDPKSFWTDGTWVTGYFSQGFPYAAASDECWHELNRPCLLTDTFSLVAANPIATDPTDQTEPLGERVLPRTEQVDSTWVTATTLVK